MADPDNCTVQPHPFSLIYAGMRTCAGNSWTLMLLGHCWTRLCTVVCFATCSESESGIMTHWGHEDTLALISIWGDASVQALLDSSYHNQAVFQEISRRLEEGSINSRQYGNSILSSPTVYKLVSMPTIPTIQCNQCLPNTCGYNTCCV